MMNGAPAPVPADQLVPALKHMLERLYSDALQDFLGEAGSTDARRLAILRIGLEDVADRHHVPLDAVMDANDLGIHLQSTDPEVTHLLLSMQIQLQVLKRLPPKPVDLRPQPARDHSLVLDQLTMRRRMQG